MSKFKFFCFSLMIVFGVVSCGEKEIVVDCTGIVSTENTYNKGIKSIIDASCATSGCHSEKDKAGGILLHNYDRVKSNFVTGKGLCSIKHKCIPMPEDEPMLSANIIKKIECWVESGAPQ